MEATPLALMSGLSAQAHYANGIKIAKCPALLITETFGRFVQSDFLWPRVAKKLSAVPTMPQVLATCLHYV